MFAFSQTLLVSTIERERREKDGKYVKRERECMKALVAPTGCNILETFPALFPTEYLPTSSPRLTLMGVIDMC